MNGKINSIKMSILPPFIAFLDILWSDLALDNSIIKEIEKTFYISKAKLIISLLYELPDYQKD